MSDNILSEAQSNGTAGRDSVSYKRWFGTHYCLNCEYQPQWVGRFDERQRGYCRRPGRTGMVGLLFEDMPVLSCTGWHPTGEGDVPALTAAEVEALWGRAESEFPAGAEVAQGRAEVEMDKASAAARRAEAARWRRVKATLALETLIRLIERCVADEDLAKISDVLDEAAYVARRLLGPREESGVVADGN